MRSERSTPIPCSPSSAGSPSRSPGQPRSPRRRSSPRTYAKSVEHTVNHPQRVRPAPRIPKSAGFPTETAATFPPLDRCQWPERVARRALPAEHRDRALRDGETEPIVAPPNRIPGTMSLTSPKPAVDPRMLKLLYFEDLHVGLREVLMKSVMDSDVVGLARLCGEHNPIHLCDVYAAQTRFGQRIAHGLYTASLISAVLGTRLPGPGAVYRSQTLNFHAPVKIGDVVTVIVEVVELIPEGRRGRVKWEAVVDGHLMLDGEAVVSVPRRPA